MDSLESFMVARENVVIQFSSWARVGVMRQMREQKLALSFRDQHVVMFGDLVCRTLWFTALRLFCGFGEYHFFVVRDLIYV